VCSCACMYVNQQMLMTTPIRVCIHIDRRVGCLLEVISRGLDHLQTSCADDDAQEAPSLEMR
jgi:hypothetical protein